MSASWSPKPRPGGIFRIPSSSHPAKRSRKSSKDRQQETRMVVRHIIGAVRCSAVQCSAVQCSAVQCSAVQCSAVQCSVVQCSALYCTAGQCMQFSAANTGGDG